MAPDLVNQPNDETASIGSDDSSQPVDEEDRIEYKEENEYQSGDEDKGSWFPRIDISYGKVPKASSVAKLKIEQNYQNDLLDIAEECHRIKRSNSYY